jgi:glycosyltransferase involved in cell wall biosynthesis
MVIVDTGSEDETPQIVEDFGARLFHYPWPDSFAEARNESLRHARGRWIFWMDSDDTIDEENVVGGMMAQEVLNFLFTAIPYSMACGLAGKQSDIPAENSVD